MALLALSVTGPRLGSAWSIGRRNAQSRSTSPTRSRAISALTRSCSCPAHQRRSVVVLPVRACSSHGVDALAYPDAASCGRTVPCLSITSDAAVSAAAATGSGASASGRCSANAILTGVGCLRFTSTTTSMSSHITEPVMDISTSNESVTHSTPS